MATKHLFALITGSLLFVACGDKDEEDTGTDGTDGTTDGADGDDGDDGTDGTTTDGADGTDGTTAEMSSIRVIHLVPDVPGVDVYVNGGADAVVPNLEFPDGTDYLEVPAATYDFQVSLAGEGPDNAAIEVEGLTLAADAMYTAAAVGSFADGNLQVLALADDDSGLASGSFRVQIVHAAEGVGEVDIWNITDPSNPGPLVTDVPFTGSTTADLPAGAYSVCFDVDNNATCDVSFDLPELPEGLFINLYAVNDASGAVFLQAQLPDSSIVKIDPR